jgi:hypothetical protein
VDRGPVLTVRYNRLLAIVSVTAGAVCLLLGLWVALLGDFTPAIVAGPAPFGVGALMLRRPYFQVGPGSVRVPAMIGPVVRDFPYDRLALDGGRLTAVGAAGPTRVPVLRWMAHGTDWALLTDLSRPHPPR